VNPGSIAPRDSHVRVLVRHKLTPLASDLLNFLSCEGDKKMRVRRERRAAEFKKLCAAAGLGLRRIVPTACPLSIVEGSAA